MLLPLSLLRERDSMLGKLGWNARLLWAIDDGWQTWYERSVVMRRKMQNQERVGVESGEDRDWSGQASEWRIRGEGVQPGRAGTWIAGDRKVRAKPVGWSWCLAGVDTATGQPYARDSLSRAPSRSLPSRPTRLSLLGWVQPRCVIHPARRRAVHPPLAP